MIDEPMMIKRLAIALAEADNAWASYDDLAIAALKELREIIDAARQPDSDEATLGELNDLSTAETTRGSGPA